VRKRLLSAGAAGWRTCPPIEKPTRRLQVTNETLFDTIDWKTYEVASGLASGHVPVRIGTAGNRGPVGVLIASVHGDEGPWSTIAITKEFGSSPTLIL
jgi:hypothetical protein